MQRTITRSYTGTAVRTKEEGPTERLLLFLLTMNYQRTEVSLQLATLKERIDKWRNDL
jgi:hypothetical protein